MPSTNDNIDKFRKLLRALEENGPHTFPIKIQLDSLFMKYFKGSSTKKSSFETSTVSSIEATQIDGRRLYHLSTNNENFISDAKKWVEAYDKGEVNMQQPAAITRRSARVQERGDQKWKPFGSQFTQGQTIKMDRKRAADATVKEEGDDHLHSAQTSNFNLNLKDTVKAVLRGENVPCRQVHEHHEMPHLTKEFHRKTKLQLAYCEFCNERWFSNDGGKFSADMTQFTCHLCLKDSTKFSKHNDMDPLTPNDGKDEATFRTEYNLLMDKYPLNVIEECLIAKNAVIMECFRLKGGSFGFRGNVISFPQRIGDISNVLPRLPKNIKVFKVVSRKTKDSKDVKTFHEFRVRREWVHRWLLFLKRFSKVYEDIEISDANLSQLPEDDSVYDELRTIGERKTTPIDEKTGSLDDSLPNDRIIGVDNGQRIENTDAKVNDSDTDEDSDDDDSDSDDSDDDNDANNGFGPESGPVLEKDTIDILNTGYGEEVIMEPEINIIRNKVVNIQWPETSSQPNDEYSTSSLLSSSFPTLFPCGAGDVTFKVNRLTDVSLSEAMKHYLKFYDNNRKRYPFASHPRFLHYLQDLDERNRIQSQASVYINQNEIDSNMTIAELKERLKGQHGESFAMNHRMSRYGANILGSPQYFGTRKKELLSLIEHKGSPTFWFTLSLPLWYWDGLKELAGVHVLDMKAWYLDNQHIVNEYFLRRAHEFLNIYFGSKGMERDWLWYRIEYQKRGSIHLHGMLRLKHDPDFPKSGAVVIEGRRALHKLYHIRDNGSFICDNIFHGELEALPQKTELNGDKIHLPDLEIDIAKHCSADNEVFSDYLQNLLQLYRQGIEAEKVLINFREFFLTSMNPNDPVDEDAASSERHPPVNSTNDSPFCHPVQVNGTIIRESDYSLTCPAVQENYKSLVTHVQRHRHHKTYCWRNDSCRFGFPRPLLPTTRLIVKDIVYARGEMKGNLKHSTVEMAFRSNDSWLNSHSPFALLSWAANLDISLIIDSRSVVNYIAKYCNKVEGPSKALNMIMKDSLQVQENNGDSSNVKKVLRRTFNKITGRRDKSVMETTHLMMSNSYVFCDHSFPLVNVLTNNRKVNIDAQTDDGPATLENLVDLYARRMIQTKWMDDTDYKDNLTLLEAMSLVEFAKRFQVKKGKIVLCHSSKPRCPIFSPDLSTTSSNHPDFWKYCLISLLRYKPWMRCRQSVYNGTVDIPMDLEEVSDLDQKMICNSFNNYFRNDSLRDSYYIDQPMTRAVSDLQKNGAIDQSPFQSLFSIESLQSVDNAMKPGGHLIDDDESNGEEIEWNKEFPFDNLNKIYKDGEIDYISLKLTMKNNYKEEKEHARRILHLEDIEGTDIAAIQQRACVTTFLKILGLWKNDQGVYEEATRIDDEYGHILMCPGPAGTGKSFVIDILVTEITERICEKHSNIHPNVLVCAPTGKAALQIGGHTINSSQGLCVPTEKLENVESHSYEDGSAKLNLQQRLKDLIALILDEFSMISSAQLLWISRRLQEATSNFSQPFGGIPVIMFGDHAQLAPVGGSSMWLEKTVSGTKLKKIAAAGHVVYAGIKNVLYLTEVRRQQGEFRDILLRLRDGRTTQDDWRTLMRTCSLEMMNEKRKLQFSNDDCLHILSTNQSCRMINRDQLIQLRTSILRVDAEHDSLRSKQLSAEYCKRLQSTLYLCVGCKVILLWNIAVSLGLVNGSLGTVEDFLFLDDEVKPPSLPTFIVVSFPDYNGNAFFEGEDRKKWVVIQPCTFDYVQSSGSKGFRRQYPIVPAYALTGWKSQGMTCHGKAQVELTDKEKSTGLTYVQLSRCTKIENLCITKSVSYDRLSNGISNSKSLQLRLLEEDRLKNLWKNTVRFYDINIHDFHERILPLANLKELKPARKKRTVSTAITIVAQPPRKKSCLNTSKSGNIPAVKSTAKIAVSNQAEHNRTNLSGIWSVMKNNSMRSVDSTLANRLIANLQILQNKLNFLDGDCSAYTVARIRSDTVDVESFVRLQPDIWLNDIIMNFFIKLLVIRESRAQDSDGAPRCHFFTTYFWTKLMDIHDTKTFQYHRVKRWTRGLSLFDKDLIFIPINIGNSHWVLIIVFALERKLVYYNSMRDDDEVIAIGQKCTIGSSYLDFIEEYLKEEYRSQDMTRTMQDAEDYMQGWEKIENPPNIPQQQNGSDCGVMVLMIMALLSSGQDLSFLLQNENHPLCRMIVANSILEKNLYNQNQMS